MICWAIERCSMQRIEITKANSVPANVIKNSRLERKPFKYADRFDNDDKYSDKCKLSSSAVNLHTTITTKNWNLLLIVKIEELKIILESALLIIVII